MIKPNWSYFYSRVNIKATPQEIMDMFLIPEKLESWFLSEADFFPSEDPTNARKKNEKIQVGDSYEWRWHGYDRSVVEKGLILEISEPNLLRFIFNKDNQVTLKILPYKDQQILELKQENILTDDQSKMNFYVGCSSGWMYYFNNLKSIMEGGIDLRNKDIDLQSILISK